jgi:hypothetical protein
MVLQNGDKRSGGSGGCATLSVFWALRPNGCTDPLIIIFFSTMTRLRFRQNAPVAACKLGANCARLGLLYGPARAELWGHPATVRAPLQKRGRLTYLVTLMRAREAIDSHRSTGATGSLANRGVTQQWHGDPLGRAGQAPCAERQRRWRQRLGLSRRAMHG